MNLNRILRSYVLPLINRRCYANANGVTPNINSFVADRTVTCGQLGKSDVGRKVKLCGWIQFQRMNNFVILRDAYGLTQLIVPAEKIDMAETLARLPFESVISVVGKVAARPAGQENKKMLTGEVEVVLDEVRVLSTPTVNLPFNIHERSKVKEPLRMQYRYLDFRHSVMQKNLRLRSEVTMKMREFLIRQHGFVDVETPTLFKRTPGGAQEFVVPTRVPDKFYSLVQSPQQFKQMLMVGGIDRYFQIARCYRDEGARPDRQPEFTQVDIEMSFSTREQIQRLIEDLLAHSWPSDSCGSAPTLPFPEMRYAEAMSRYGVDKPDTRFGNLLQDVTETVRNSEMSRLFSACQREDFAAVAIVFKQCAPYLTRSTEESLTKLAGETRSAPAAGHGPDRVTLLTVRLDAQCKWKSSLSKKLNQSTMDQLGHQLGATEPADVILLAIGPRNSVVPSMGKIRLAMADHLESEGVPIRSDGFHFLWVVDFPLFLKDEEGRLESAHHPFTAPHPADVDLLYQSPSDVRGQHYDLVLNGSEIGGGSIRIHQPDIQKYVLDQLLHVDPSSLQHLIHALQCGCPPHGGIALGLDRLMAILCGASSIRDVIAFPKGFAGQDIMSGAPAAISELEKKIYHLKSQ